MIKMKPITKAQIIAINTVISNKALDKKQVILDASSGRTASSRELTFEEAHNLLHYLNDSRQATIDKMVRKMVAIAYDLNWIQEKPVVESGGKVVMKKDFSRLYQWVKKYGSLKKDLKQYNEKELPALITQLEQVAGYYLKK
jgi:hypothetical protein